MIKSDLTKLIQSIEKIEARNRKVERDKAWETSKTRRSLITLLTYAVMVLFMKSLGNDAPLKNALIPTLGFFLSTLTLSFGRKIWEKRLRS
jgi:hypothetical protein